MPRDIFEEFKKVGLDAYRPSENRKKAQIKVLIFGESGAGKTAIAGSFPDCLLLDVDDGAQATLDSEYCRSLGIHETTTVVRVSNVAEIRKAMKILRKNRKAFKSLAIDTISILSMNTVSNMISGEAEETEEDDASTTRYMETRDWGRLLNELYRVMKEAVDIGLNLCVTSHVAEKEDSDGKEKKMPLLQGAFKDMSPAFFDVMGYMFMTTVKEKAAPGKKPKSRKVRRVQFEGNSKVKAKDRTGRLGKYADDITYDYLKRALIDGESMSSADESLEEDLDNETDNVTSEVTTSIETVEPKKRKKRVE